jgi:hypothetical protein
MFDLIFQDNRVFFAGGLIAWLLFSLYMVGGMKVKEFTEGFKQLGTLRIIGFLGLSCSLFFIMCNFWYLGLLFFAPSSLCYSLDEYRKDTKNYSVPRKVLWFVLETIAFVSVCVIIFMLASGSIK